MENSLDLKEIIRQEYLLCAKDPVHFLRKYCFIQHPKKGKIIFNLYPFQIKVIRLWEKHEYIILNKSRQLGISTVIAGLSLWMMLFQDDKNILCIATKQETAKNMVIKVQFMYNNLPSWLKVEAEEFNKLSLKLKNGSVIKATTTASDSARSEALSLLIIDEAAFIDNMDDIWASAQQTLALGGNCFVISTPNGTGNWFHKTYTLAETSNNPDNKFLPIKLPWFVHPERDENWRKKQDSLLGDPRIAAQECDADFQTSGDTVFLSEWLSHIRENTIEEPIERRGLNKDLWIWREADYTREYLVVGDVARGDGKDSSGAIVIDIESNEQVAEYKGQLSPREFGFLLIALATEYNNALLVVENNNMGWATIETILERGYNNLYYSPKGDPLKANSYLRQFENPNDSVPGFGTSLLLRPLVINKFREYVYEKSLTIRSARLLGEMEVFIWKNGRGEAQYGYNDDLVMCTAISQYLRDTSLKYSQGNLDLTMSVLSNIQTSRKQYTGAYMGGYKSVPNPYSFNNQLGQSEDITWLLK
jgi:hypothetical protein